MIALVFSPLIGKDKVRLKTLLAYVFCSAFQVCILFIKHNCTGDS